VSKSSFEQFITMQTLMGAVLCVITKSVSYRPAVCTVWVNPPPCGFLVFFPKRLGIFNQFLTNLSHVHIYARLQTFIQLSPILMKLCHT